MTSFSPRVQAETFSCKATRHADGGPKSATRAIRVFSCRSGRVLQERHGYEMASVVSLGLRGARC
jgi:hypothetical protein